MYKLIFKNYHWIPVILRSTRTLEYEPIEEIFLTKKYINLNTNLIPVSNLVIRAKRKTIVELNLIRNSRKIISTVSDALPLIETIPGNYRYTRKILH